MSDPILVAKGLKKTYGDKKLPLEILKGVDLEVCPGDALCIVGASGAGKSTLLHLLGALDRPTEGEIYFKGKLLSHLPDEELARFRNKSVGFVFQFHHLLSELTAFENAMLPARIGGEPYNRSSQKVEELFQMMGLSSRKTHYPNQLSGGEQQRVAIARALVQSPEILFADEPTGNLDTQNANKIQDLFFSLKDRLGLSLVVVTHDPNFASRFPRRLGLRDGYWN